jgi:hypothetical protein
MTFSLPYLNMNHVLAQRLLEAKANNGGALSDDKP